MLGKKGNQAALTIAEEGQQRIQALYAIEATITGLPRAPPRRALGPQQTVAGGGWRRSGAGSGKSDLGKALQYALGRWDALVRYLDDGRLSIDNNLAERLLRCIAVTKKNILFLGSDAGGERAAIIYTIAETAKLNGHNPEAYITTVLDRIAKGHLASTIDDLLPWNLTQANQAVVVG
jgi:transposase